jgi:antitoxin YefM
MDVVSYSAARQEFAKTMTQVCENHSPVVVTRGNNQPVVIISLEDFNALQETAYLLKSGKNAKRLYTAVDEIEAMIAKDSKKRTKKT